MPHQPEVSVLMAAYNAESYISTAIESIRAQTLTNWQLIICNDASTDGTVAQCRRAAASDPRIRLVTHDTNRGQAAARNTAFRAARADYVAIMDDDDSSHPDRLRRQLRCARQHPNELISTGYTFLRDTAAGACDLYLPRELTNAGLWVTCALCGPSLMMHRDIYVDLDGYDENHRELEDIDLIVRANVNGCSVRIVAGNLYRYRVHAESINGQDRRGVFRRLNGYFSRMWNAHLNTDTSRNDLFVRAMAGLRSSDWPLGMTHQARRKAASIAALLAIRFAAMGDREPARQLLREALRICWWRVDAAITRLTIPFGIGIQLTGLGDRVIPHLVVRRRDKIWAMI